MEKVVAKAQEMEDGEMKEIEVNGQEVLLVKIQGEFYAVGAKCTHFGAPLADGVLHRGRLRCPWHQACFDAASGELEEPPALDALSKFDTRVEDGEVIVVVPEGATSEPSPETVEQNLEEDDRTFLIIGAGGAGGAAAESLRQFGFQGRIKIVTKEKYAPYDRTQLSKNRLADGKNGAPKLRSTDFYEENDIELLKEREVTGLDPVGKEVSFLNGDSLGYDKLLLAPGSEPNRLEVPGGELENVFTLRNPSDLEQINPAAEKASKVVIVGSSFIGMEAAASLRDRGLEVTVVSLNSVPFELVLGRRVGEVYAKTHMENGVSFEMGTRVEEFRGTDKVEEVKLADGTTLPADLVVLGVGVTPTTSFLQGDLELAKDGGLAVDDHLRVSKDIYAAGDVARFPDWRTDEEVRIEHWRLAQQHGRLAARNMVGEEKEFRSLPIFWTNQFDLYLRYVGHVSSWEETVLTGDLEEKQFIAYYVRGGRVLAAAGANVNLKMAALAELMEEGEMPGPDEISAGEFDPVEALGELRA